MTKFARVSLTLLRVGLGWMFFYAGLSKVLDPSWTAAGYLSNAQSLPQLFDWFLAVQNIGWVDFLNQWGLLLIGAALILGLFVRFASFCGALMMVLYWLVVLDFPTVGHGIIIDDHIIYVFAFLVLMALNAGRYWGLDARRRRLLGM